VHAHIFESFNLSYSCSQVVTTTLPFSKSLDDCSNGFIMSSYILPAHVWVHAAPKDVTLRVITSTERAFCFPYYWLLRHVYTANQTGNPMLNAQLSPKTMLKGYGNHATQLGYQKKRVVPLTEREMQLLLQSMHKSCNNSSTNPHQHMLLLQDGEMLFSLLWQSCLRGFNAGALRLDNVVLLSGENAVPYLVPELRLQAGAVLHLLPDITKNKKGGVCKITLSRDVICLSTWFQIAVHTTQLQASPLPTTPPGHWEWESSSLLRSQ